MTANIDAIKSGQAKGWTVGVVPPPGSPLPLRLELDDFLQDTELANLYFVAMESFMSDAASRDPFSYYEISGIHGQPRRSWNRQPQSPEWNPQDGAARRFNYCSHSSLIFPTWHRAYLAQFEQGLYVHAAALAPALKAEKVLDRFRIPFFDPLLPRQTGSGRYVYGVPIILTLPNIMVKKTADGPWVSIPNPLYSFRFGDAARRELDFRSWEGLRNPSRQTMRAYDFQRDQPNHQILIQALDNLYNPQNNLSATGFDNLYRVMMDETQNWTTMSNSARSFDLGMNSLEGFHDNLHVQISWGMPRRVDRDSPRGHMSDPDFAAFDPVFWLHHCNVDRLLAIWQGLKSQAPESVQWWSANSRPRNDRQPASFWARTPDTDLVPFVKSADANGRTVFWKSRDLRDWRTLGHDYPETAAARTARDGYVSALRRWANTQLGWLGRITRTGDPAAIAKLNDSLTRSIPFFPKEILIDGEKSRPLNPNQAFIGSKAVTTPAPPVARGLAPQFAAMSVAEPDQSRVVGTPPVASAPPPVVLASTSDSGPKPTTTPTPAPAAPAARAAPVTPTTSTPSTSSPSPPAEGTKSHRHHHSITSLTSKLTSALPPAVTAAVPASVSKAVQTKLDQAQAKFDQAQTKLDHLHDKASHLHSLAHSAASQIHDQAAERHELLRQRVLQRALPDVDLSFADRFGRLGDVIKGETIVQWNVTFTIDKFCLDGSFVIDFFIGDFAAEHGTWVLDGHLAGQSAVFASGRERMEEGCENCREQEAEGMVYGDTVGLTEALLVYRESGEAVHGLRVTGMGEEVVVPFLKRNLHWRVEGAKGEDIPREAIPSLKIGVFSEVVHLPRVLTDLPRFEGRKLHYEITQGRPNGLNPGETF